MTITARKYNPGFLSDDELVTSFCVRTNEFDSLMEALRECSGNSNIHQLLIGPRGSGKTTLLLRVAAEIQRDADLSSRFFPVVFAEESYEVSSAGEFWLECLSRLADQAPQRDDGPDLHRTFEELRHIRDDRMLADRCIGTLQDFSDRQGKRLVAVVENLNMMFRDITGSQAGWRLRQTLQTEPRILLLASATSRFQEIDSPKRALYELFRVLTLRPLEVEECADLWQTVSGRPRPRETIRALRILTGGSPRLLTILARFGGNLSFRQLMADLLDLVDDHTEYFKSHLDALPQQERRVYLALADIWKPANTREIADRARLDTSKCSAQLARLIDRGAVEVAGGTARRKLYYVAERLYNIYYLLRRSRGPVPLIEALIRFMEGYYSPEELRQFGVRIALEAATLDDEAQMGHRAALARLIESPSLAMHREELISFAPWMARDGSADQRHVSEHPVAAQTLYKQAFAFTDTGHIPEALAVWEELVRRFGDSDAQPELEYVAIALINKGIALGTMKRPNDALAAWQEVVNRFESSDGEIFQSTVAKAHVSRAAMLGTLNFPEDALAICNSVLDRFTATDSPAVLAEVANALSCKGVTLAQLNRPTEAVTAWDEVVQRFGSSEKAAVQRQVALTLLAKGEFLSESKRPKEALEAWGELEQRFASSEIPSIRDFAATALHNRGATLIQLNRLDEALVAHDDVVERFGSNDTPTLQDIVSKSLLSKGVLLAHMNRPREALGTWDQVVQRFETSDHPTLRYAAQFALFNKAALELARGRSKAAISAVDRGFEVAGTEQPWDKLRGHLIRAQAHMIEGDRAACEQDVEALLSILPRLSSLQKYDLDDLCRLAVDLGIERMRELIKASPAASLLLPLTTALEKELGFEPRVAKEVEEIAEDIRRDLKRYKKELSTD